MEYGLSTFPLSKHPSYAQNTLRRSKRALPSMLYSMKNFLLLEFCTSSLFTSNGYSLFSVLFLSLAFPSHVDEWSQLKCHSHSPLFSFFNSQEKKKKKKTWVFCLRDLDTTYCLLFTTPQLMNFWTGFPFPFLVRSLPEKKNRRNLSRGCMWESRISGASSGFVLRSF